MNVPTKTEHTEVRTEGFVPDLGAVTMPKFYATECAHACKFRGFTEFTQTVVIDGETWHIVARKLK